MSLCGVELPSRLNFAFRICNGMVSYAAPKTFPPFFVREAQGRSCEWLKPGIENRGIMEYDTTMILQYPSLGQFWRKVDNIRCDGPIFKYLELKTIPRFDVNR